MGLVNYLMFYGAVGLCVVKCKPQWIPYRGLWYYISDENDKVIYAEAVRKCQDMNGRLAVMAGDWHWKNIATISGGSERWIFDSDMRNIPTTIRYDGGLRIDTHSRPTDKYFGYICDWQCHKIGVYSQVYIPIEGMYSLQQSNSTRQKYIQYTAESIIQIYKTGSYWCFDNDDDCWRGYYAYRDVNNPVDFTPYNDTEWLYPYYMYNAWYYRDFTVNFVCQDCQTLSIALTNDNMNTLSDVFYRSPSSTILHYKSNIWDSTFEYDSVLNQWCLYWQDLYTHCTANEIYPTTGFNYTFTVVNQDVSTTVSVSCITNPILQITTETTLADTTPDPDFQASTTSNMHIQEASSFVGSTAPRTTSSTTIQVTYSKRIEPPTTPLYDKSTRNYEFLGTSEASDSGKLAGAIPSDNTNKYIAIACAVGGVIIIVIVIVAVVIGLRRKKKQQTPNSELNVPHEIGMTEANIYSINPTSNAKPLLGGFSCVIPDVVNDTSHTYANPESSIKQGHTTNENLYSEAANVDLGNEHVYINSGFVPQSDNTQDEDMYTQVPSTLSKKRTENENKKHDEKNESETEFCNNDIYDDGRDAAQTRQSKTTPDSSASESDLELYNNSMYEGSDQNIDQSKPELTQNVDEEVKMYDNDVYGS